VWSGRGPSSDGRFKPDLVVPGQDILSAATPVQEDPDHFVFTAPGHCAVPSPFQPRSPEESANLALQVYSGTSMATPLMAGAVEKIRQYFIQGYYPDGILGMNISYEPAEALVRAVILASCESVLSDPSWAVANSHYTPTIPSYFSPTLSPSSPNFFQGFGLPVLDHAVYMNGSTNGHRMYYAHGIYSPNSTATAYNISCDHARNIYLTIALVWTDPPGDINSQKQLVNDIDLIVLVPGSTPSQIFGNMRSVADQHNTVERVVTRCPVAGFVTAIVAPGYLQTLSQEWFLVANGPLKSVISRTALPPYMTGRPQTPATQSQPCYSDSFIYVKVNFKPSSLWSCVGQSSLKKECSVKAEEFTLSLAETVGVPLQGIRVLMSNISGVFMQLACSAMISNVHNDRALLSYVTPISLGAAIRSITNPMLGADSVLSVFDWSTFAEYPSGSSMISMSMYTYNEDCSVLSEVDTFDSLSCHPVNYDVLVLFYQAVSCKKGEDGSTEATYAIFTDSHCRTGFLLSETRINGTCLPFGGYAEIFTCSLVVAPPTTVVAPPTTTAAKINVPSSDASSGLSNSAASSGVIAGSIIGAAACKHMPSRLCITSIALELLHRDSRHT
jgi:hypothetical protein